MLVFSRVQREGRDKLHFFPLPAHFPSNSTDEEILRKLEGYPTPLDCPYTFVAVFYREGDRGSVALFAIRGNLPKNGAHLMLPKKKVVQLGIVAPSLIAQHYRDDKNAIRASIETISAEIDCHTKVRVARLGRIRAQQTCLRKLQSTCGATTARAQEIRRNDKALAEKRAQHTQQQERRRLLRALHRA